MNILISNIAAAIVVVQITTAPISITIPDANGLSFALIAMVIMVIARCWDVDTDTFNDIHINIVIDIDILCLWLRDNLNLNIVSWY